MKSAAGKNCTYGQLLLLRRCKISVERNANPKKIEKTPKSSSLLIETLIDKFMAIISKESNFELGEKNYRALLGHFVDTYLKTLYTL